ncbi:2Fe-2S iron-sulfur cluster-binding protein [Bradyrhizobium lupini]|uniref:2Fe-2S iron-sulfur cluster-binding protein n=1 Tax=Rhizobium lupini TaxID=136996 RepID=UPI00366BC543
MQRRSADVDIPISCEQGICGTCETRVLGGVPDHDDQILSDEEKVFNCSMMVCRSGVSVRLWCSTCSNERSRGCPIGRRIPLQDVCDIRRDQAERGGHMEYPVRGFESLELVLKKIRTHRAY